MNLQSAGTRAFREALGRFATGVTVVTASADDGTPVGVTANSFNSVSLEPPMVLWSLAKSSKSLSAFQRAEEFAIHVLGSHQEAISSRFAAKGAEKFAGVEWRLSAGGAPLLSDCAARFVCKTAYQYEGGDHVIFVGEVLAYEHSDKPPLLFHAGGYVEAANRVAAPPASGIDDVAARVTEDYLAFLLTRAYFQITQGFVHRAHGLGMNREQQRAIVVLGGLGPLTLGDLQERLAFTASPPDVAFVEGLLRRGWVTWAQDKIELTLEGRAIFLATLSFGKAQEDLVLSQLSHREAADLRRLLKRLVAITDPELRGA